MNVGDLKTYVRNQADMDSVDLPDAVLNVYMQEAFDRTIAFSNKWPKLESFWSLGKTANVDTIAVPADLNVPSIQSIYDPQTRIPLKLMDHGTMLQEVLPTTGVPAFASIWNGQIWLWPRAVKANTYSIHVRGYRQPVWTNNSADIPDLDVRLHVTLAYFALSLVYAREEDEVMEGIYLGRWNRDLTQQLKTILEPSSGRPFVLGGGGIGTAVSNWVINPPAP